MKCLNCSAPALYVLSGSVKDRVYCKEHLPWTVSLKKDLGGKVLLLDNAAPVTTPKVEKPVVEEVVPVVEEKKTKKKEEVKVEEAVVEDSATTEE